MRIEHSPGPGGFMEPILEPFMGQLTCYIAGPEGFSETTRDWMNIRLIPAIENEGVLVLSPWDLTLDDEVVSVHSMAEGPDKVIALAELVFRIADRNCRAMEIASFATASLEGQEVDSGTSGEVGAYAAMHRFLRPIIGRRSDFRQTGEVGAICNLQTQYWIRRTEAVGGCVTRSLDETVEKVRLVVEQWKSQNR